MQAKDLTWLINGIESKWLSGTCFATTAHGGENLYVIYHHCNNRQFQFIGEDELLIVKLPFCHVWWIAVFQYNITSINFPFIGTIW